MKHSPAEYFIRYLCSRPKTTPAEVKNYVGGMAIGQMPSETYIDDLHAEVQSGIPPNYNPRDFTHKLSQQFLKAHKIRGMWRSTYSIKEAVDVFMSGPVREIVEALILTGMSDEEVAEVLSHYKAINVIGTSITEFRHYFWNTELLSFDEWTHYLSEPSKQLIKLTALKSPKSLDGIRLTLYKMGIMPREMDKRQIFSSMRDIGYMNFLEGNGLSQGRHKAEMLNNYASIVRGSQDKLDEYEAGEQDVINEFYKNLTVSSHRGKQKTLIELQGENNGQGSVRGLPSGDE